MSRSIEVELKFEIIQPQQVAAFVHDMPVLEQKHIADVYLDTKAGDLFKKGIFIRIRNGKKFDIKFNKDEVHLGLEDSVDHTHCDEVSSPLPLVAESLPAINEALEFLGMVPLATPSLDEFKAANKLVDSMIIDKERTSYDGGEFHIDVDTVKNLGTFLEIEKMTDEHPDRQQIVAAMHKRLQGLDLHHVDTGYNELYWRKYDFDLYLQGKYLLIEDRQKYRPQTIKH
jgi:adenylate cyclase class IV